MTAVNLRDVKFSYPGDKEKLVLDIPSWSLAAGDQVFLHGPSGGGKSTLLNLLSGILPTSSGEVVVLGHNLDKLSSRSRDRFRAQNVGYVFQQFNLIPYLDAISNIQLARFFAKKPSKRNLTDDIESLLTKLNVDSSDWRKPTANLSIGQQQRVAIARAIINMPRLLIADEPTSALDQENRNKFLSILTSLVSEHEMTLIFVSHDLSLAKNFKHSFGLSEINR